MVASQEKPSTIASRPDLLTARMDGEIVGLGLLVSTPPGRPLFLKQTGDVNQDSITIEYNDILADRDITKALGEWSGRDGLVTRCLG